MRKIIQQTNDKKGFTLIELLIAMAITGIVTAGIFTALQSQQKSYLVQEDTAEMQQNIRAATYLMGREIRMAGYDPENSGFFAVTDITPRDISNNLDLTANGNSHIQFTSDFDADGIIDADETVSYSIFDFPVAAPDGQFDLARDIGAGRQLIAENIEAMGMAYAFDADDDGLLDTYNAGGVEQVIWAVDSDGDNDLDRNLDTNGDGNIDEADGPVAGGIIPGQALVDFGGNPISDVGLDAIRAVRIYLLSIAENSDNKFFNNRTYVVGNKIVQTNDAFRRRLLVTTVKCRNLEL